MNVFFSNFSEISIRSFTKADLTDKDLIFFGVHHEYVNNNKRVTPAANGKVKIKKDFIEKAAAHYFGKSIGKYQIINEIELAEDFYSMEQSSGKMLFFSQVESLIDNGARTEGFGNTYTVKFNVYEAGLVGLAMFMQTGKRMYHLMTSQNYHIR